MRDTTVRISSEDRDLLNQVNALVTKIGLNKIEKIFDIKIEEYDYTMGDAIKLGARIVIKKLNQY